MILSRTKGERKVISTYPAVCMTHVVQMAGLLSIVYRQTIEQFISTAVIYFLIPTLNTQHGLQKL